MSRKMGKPEKGEYELPALVRWSDLRHSGPASRIVDEEATHAESGGPITDQGLAPLRHDHQRCCLRRPVRVAQTTSWRPPALGMGARVDGMMSSLQSAHGAARRCDRPPRGSTSGGRPIGPTTENYV
jgi:hypothetical protein